MNPASTPPPPWVLRRSSLAWPTHRHDVIDARGRLLWTVRDRSWRSLRYSRLADLDPAAETGSLHLAIRRGHFDPRTHVVDRDTGREVGTIDWGVDPVVPELSVRDQDGRIRALITREPLPWLASPLSLLEPRYVVCSPAAEVIATAACTFRPFAPGLEVSAAPGFLALLSPTLLLALAVVLQIERPPLRPPEVTRDLRQWPADAMESRAPDPESPRTSTGNPT